MSESEFQARASEFCRKRAENKPLFHSRLGIGQEGYVWETLAGSAIKVFERRGNFENDAASLAPAQQVIVTDTLDNDLDLSSYQLTEIAFAGESITVPPGLDRYETTMPFVANGTTVQVYVLASLDRDTRQLTLTLTSPPLRTSR